MNFSNFTEHCPATAVTTQETIAKIVALALIGVFGFIGNVLTIAVVHRERALHNTVNYLIVNMALSDLMIPLIVLPNRIFNLATYRSDEVWLVTGDFGTALCKVFFFTADISSLVSILSLIFITVDRFCAIMFPLRAGTAPLARVNKILIVLTWILPALSFIPILYSYSLQKVGNQTLCLSNYGVEPLEEVRIQTIFYTLLFAFYIMIPFFVLTVMYTMILAKLRQQDHSITAQSQSKKDRMVRYHKTRRVVFMALTIIVVFAVCWIPLNVLVFMLYHHWKFDISRICYFNILAFIVQFLSYTNPMLNPIIYFVFIEKFRKGLYNLISCRKRMLIQQTILNSAGHSEGRENSGRGGRSMVQLNGNSPRTRASSNASVHFQTHKL